MNYRIREIDGEKNADILADLHERCFGETAPQADYSHGHWWIAYHEKEPVAFAGLTPSQLGFNTGYLKRVGVIPTGGHRGKGLQKRLVRVRIARAKKNGWSRVVTDTTLNPASSNALIKNGFKIFQPRHGWAFDHTIYWQKTIC